MSCYSIRINGTPATTIAPHTPPTWETLADGGCGAASWAFAMSTAGHHHALRAGALVEIYIGSTPVYAGLLTEPDRTTWECQAQGLAFSKKLALDAANAATRDVGVAIEQAALRGWQVTNPSAISGLVDGDATDIQTVTALLDQRAEQLGKRWGVDAHRRIFMTTDPTIPMWTGAPGVGAFGATNEGSARAVAGLYVEGDLPKTLVRGDVTGDEEVVDLTERGNITTAQATSILDQILETRKSGVGWVNGVTLSRAQLTANGARAALPLIRGGQMMQTVGLSQLALNSGAMHLSVVIGKTRYTAGEDEIYLEPVNTAPRNLRDVVAAT